MADDSLLAKCDQNTDKENTVVLKIEGTTDSKKPRGIKSDCITTDKYRSSFIAQYVGKCPDVSTLSKAN